MSSASITKTVLADSMKKLMAKQPLGKISVGEIVGHCGLNRNSFYYHFKDKYDLVNWIFYTEFAQAMQGQEEAYSSWAALEDICEFFYENRVFYANALSTGGQNSFAEYFNELIQSILVVRAEELFEENADREFFAIFIADVFLVAISRWLLEGAKTPPDELTAKIRRVLTSAAVKIMEAEETAARA